VFSDLAVILNSRKAPNGDYNRLVRPWKSRFGLYYIATRSLRVDLELIALTALCLVAPARARSGVQRILRRTGAPEDLVRVAGRMDPLVPTLPPGVTASDWRKHLTYSV
jgi:hypothetical protein